jgi:hypothetical protein
VAADKGAEQAAWLWKVLGFVPPSHRHIADLATFTTRLSTLIKTLTDAGHDKAGAAALRAKLSEAGLLARKHDFAKAEGLLDEVETALAGSGAPASGRGALLPIWEAAKETVDAQITTLQAAFRGTNHPLGQIIADKGLTGLTRRLFVPMMTALMECDGAPPQDRTRAAARATEVLGQMRAFLDAHPAIPYLERNPFGVSISVKAVLGAAVTEIEGCIAGRQTA